jgi:hypothetical protein
MGKRPRVIITVNPGLIEGKRFQTIRSLVTALDKECDLSIAPVSEYDYGKRKIAVYRQISGGRFQLIGMVRPSADLWIIYSDGYYLNFKELGFEKRIELLNAQFGFHEEFIASGAIHRMINTPDGERHTLKNWFAELDPVTYQIGKSYLCRSAADVHGLVLRLGCVIAKPNWGGGMLGVVKLDNDQAIRGFIQRIEECGGAETLEDYVFQDLMDGPEKRLWFLGDEIVAARIIHDRDTPWRTSDNTRIEAFTENVDHHFGNEVSAARMIWRKAGLQVGAVDFIGERINELNGCGTLFTQYERMRKIIDVRPKLNAYMIAQAHRSTEL